MSSDPERIRILYPVVQSFYSLGYVSCEVQNVVTGGLGVGCCDYRIYSTCRCMFSTWTDSDSTVKKE